MYFKKNLLLFLFFLIAISNSFGQNSKYSTSNKGAIKSYEDGTKYLDSQNYDKAIGCFTKAIEKEPNFVEAYMVLGDIYTDKNDIVSAIKNYSMAVKVNADFFPNNFFHLAQLHFHIGNYKDCLVQLEEYTNRVKNIETNKSKKVDFLKSCAQFGIEAMNNPVDFHPKNLGNGINSVDPEYYPSMTVDQQKIIFTRRIKDERIGGREQEDFYISNKVNDEWTKAVNPGQPINSLLNEGAPSISADGKLVFFAACERPDGKGRCDIYLSQQATNGSWTSPINLGEPINTGAWETQPSFSSDGKTLYFVRGYVNSNRQMVQDIFESTFQKDMTWSKPKPLNSNINTTGSEESVFIHPDNQTLYFSSDGHIGMGGLDIFMSRKQSDGEWGPAINLGYPINTCNDENSMLVSPDGKTAYFSSNRKDGYGDLDLYSFQLPTNLQPLLVSYVNARVVDGVTGNPLAAQFEIIDIATEKIVLSNTTDKKRGEFLACLSAGKNYMLNVYKEGYLFYSDYFECKEANDEQHAYNLLIKLNQPKAGEKVVLKNVFFDTNQFNLKKESFVELKKLVQLLTTNKTMIIEIAGHTDSVGDVQSNLVLSNNRAKAIYNYLLEQGIGKERLSYKGYGDKMPIGDNGTELGRSQNRRTEFIIK